MPTKKMEVRIVNDYESLQTWATDCMDYVPIESSIEVKIHNDKGFHSKLTSGRLGIYWQYLIQHARSRSQVQHIRDNLKVLDYQEAKNKKNAQILSFTSDKDVTFKFDKPKKGQQDISSMTFELESSSISNRSLLIKEFEETRHLVKKCSSKIHRTNMEIQSLLIECEELKSRLQEHEDHTNQNFEKLNFLQSLKKKTKDSIDNISHYSGYLEQTLIQRFNLCKPQNVEVIEANSAHSKNLLLVELRRCKSIIDQVTKSNSDQNTCYVSAQVLGEVKSSLNGILLPKSNKQQSIDYHTISIQMNESILHNIRSIIRNLEAKIKAKDIEPDVNINDELQYVLNSWREKHVNFSSQAKVLDSEVRELENANQRQVKLVKSAIEDVLNSGTSSSHSNTELKTALHRYFFLSEKYERTKSAVKQLQGNLIKMKSTFKDTNLKLLVNLCSTNTSQIESKRTQIKRLLQRNSNLDTRFNWLESKVIGILKGDIKQNIMEILYQTPTNQYRGHHLSASQDIVHRILSLFVSYPKHLELSLKINNNVCGRDVTWFLNSIRNLHLNEECYSNSLMVIENFSQCKSLMNSVNKFLKEAKLMEQNFSSFEEGSADQSTEKRVKDSKEHGQLIKKIDNIIEQVHYAIKHTGMRM